MFVNDEQKTNHANMLYVPSRRRQNVIFILTNAELFIFTATSEFVSYQITSRTKLNRKISSLNEKEK